LQWVEELRQQSDGRLHPSSTTEFVVGAAGEHDVEILSTTEYLHRQLKLARVYFSAFRPIHDTPLDNLPATDPARQLRLYQASFLLRDYGFEVEELPFAGEGDLPTHTDPKRAWADEHLTHAPVEINTPRAVTCCGFQVSGVKG
jgi:predicted DNA-binding helix-hairpin-helix protein